MSSSRQRRRLLPHIRAVLASAIAAVAGTQALAQAARPPAEVLAGSGRLGDPAARRRAAQEIGQWQAERRRLAQERGRRFGLPLRVDLPDGRARELVDWEEDVPLYVGTVNAAAAISSASSVIRVAPYLADGAGGTVGVWDAGAVRSTHRELTGRVTVRESIAPHPHSTHVGGTIAAAGVSSAARGMAVAARIDSYDWNADISEMTGRGAAYGGEPGKLALSNHSYGYLSGWYSTGGYPAYEWYGAGTTATAYEDDFGKYNSYAQQTDALAWNLPYYLVFWAAGNERTDNPGNGSTVALVPGGAAYLYDAARHPPGDGAYRGGYDTISYNALAKNVMTVGAVNDAVLNGQRDISKATIASFSSWGPADDGRIKPDVVANGTTLYSCDSAGDASYATMSGTSMATPSAAGTAQQLARFYTQRFSGRYMRASMLKALLIHTADDLGSAGPDYRFGWGLLNAGKAADLVVAAAADPVAPRLVEQQLSVEAPSRVHRFDWDGISPIRATLCWTDPAGTAVTGHDVRTARLVNNLNLQIRTPSGSTRLPWVMPFVGKWTTAAFSAAAITGTNNTDNVEQVLIAAPAAGTYEAVVSFNGTLSGGSQDYALVLSGVAAPPPDVLRVTPDEGESGALQVVVDGEGFAAGSSVALESGTASVAATVLSVTVNAITCSLDLSALTPGPWDVRVTRPDGRHDVLPAGFTAVGTLWSRTFEPSAAGWCADANIGFTHWALRSTGSHTPPNCFFAPGPAIRNTDNLVSEAIAIPATARRTRLHVWHAYGFEPAYDGGVLELSVDGGPFVDVASPSSGASFLKGGYTGVIDGKAGNPGNRSEFYNRSAWVGSVTAYTEVVVDLPEAVFAGKVVRFRWRLGTDASTASAGWSVDSVRLTGYGVVGIDATPPGGTVIIVR